MRILLCILASLGACTPSPPKPTDTGGACDRLDAEAADGPETTVTLRNDRDVTVFVPWATVDCTWEPLTLWLDGERVLWDPAAWVPTCEDLLAESCAWGCSDGPSSVLRLEPGASHAFPWAGYVHVPETVDGACAEATGCADGSVCWAGRQLRDTALTAVVRVAETCGLEDCACTGDACLLAGDSLTIGAVPATEVAFDVTWDGSNIVIGL